MSTLASYVCNERGAEMVEWVVVVAVLAIVAVAAYGPSGLQGAITGGLTHISTTIGGLPS